MLKSEIVRISDGRQFPLCADADVYVPPLFFSGTIFIFVDARANSSCYIARSDWVLHRCGLRRGCAECGQWIISAETETRARFAPAGAGAPENPQTPGPSANGLEVIWR